MICHIRITLLAVCFTVLLSTTFARAQSAPPPAPMGTYTGNIGGGLARTGGNTHTSNFNFTAGLVRDPKTRNVVKTSAAYLRGTQDDILNLDRATFNLRDEYTFSGRVFTFGQLDFVRDQFKQIIFFWAPTAGIGYNLIKTDVTTFSVDGGAGGVLEKNPGIPAKKSGSTTASERFAYKFSTKAAFTESLSSIWKTDDWSDSLTNFSVGVTSTVVGNVQVKVEFLDVYKNKLTNPSLKKNDTAFVTAFVLKF